MRKGSDRAFEAATDIISRLRTAGHVALLAGGCVRDRLLNLSPKDYDVATDATPVRVQKLFPHARRVGAMFGVMLVHKYGCDVEVATFRADGTYSDGRHPDEVRFGTDLDDALRRDFTINGLFEDPADGRVIDHVGGRADLSARLIRTIGDSEKRFAEDHLRLIRAIRFSAKLGFAIESETWSAINRMAPSLRAISTERVWQELERMLTDPTRAEAWKLLLQSGLRNHLVPEWPADTKVDAMVEARLAALPSRVVDSELALAAALLDHTPQAVLKIGRSLRLSNRLVRSTSWLVESILAARRISELESADLKILMSCGTWANLPLLLEADLVARGESFDQLDALRSRVARIPHQEIAPPPLLKGDELIALGFPSGPRLGRALSEVYRAQLNGVINCPEEAISLARSLLANKVEEDSD
jgi:tRNA nucleotidyltransferase/poly(A) polymerase